MCRLSLAHVPHTPATKTCVTLFCCHPTAVDSLAELLSLWRPLPAPFSGVTCSFVTTTTSVFHIQPPNRCCICFFFFQHDPSAETFQLPSPISSNPFWPSCSHIVFDDTPFNSHSAMTYTNILLTPCAKLTRTA